MSLLLRVFLAIFAVVLLVAILFFAGFRFPGGRTPAVLSITATTKVTPPNCASKKFVITARVTNNFNERLILSTTTPTERNVAITFREQGVSVAARGSEDVHVEGELVLECGNGEVGLEIVGQVANDPQPPRTASTTPPVLPVPIPGHPVRVAALGPDPLLDPLDATPTFSHTVAIVCCGPGALTFDWRLPPPPGSENITNGRPVSQPITCPPPPAALVANPALVTGTGAIADGEDRGNTVHELAGGGKQCQVSRDVERLVLPPVEEEF